MLRIIRLFVIGGMIAAWRSGYTRPFMAGIVIDTIVFKYYIAWLIEERLQTHE